MAKSNDEMIADFMQFRSVLHHLYTVNGLYIYSKLIAAMPLEELAKEWRCPGFSPGEWQMCAKDFIKAFDQHLKQEY